VYQLKKAGEKLVDQINEVAKQVEKQDISNVPPKFSLSAQELFNENARNTAAAAAKYKGSVVEGSGVVNGFMENYGEAGIVTLKVEGQPLGLMCNTFEAEPWKKVHPGQQVKLKGRWPPFSEFGLNLLDCVFTELGPSTAVSVTAEQLAQEYAADQ